MLPEQNNKDDYLTKAGRQFCYNAISQGSRDFRFVDLLQGDWIDPVHCNIRTVSLDDNLEYEALSYVWGDNTISRPILLNEQIIQATSNLSNALQHLRKPDETLTLWIDAICINQQDVDEKSHQVGMMGDLYKK